MPELGPGIALLLVPSLIADALPQPEVGITLMRATALGVVALIVVLWGFRARLQAPLLIGASVLVVHAVALLWPWIAVAYEATTVWLWVAAGGALLVFVAASYEKRIRDARAAASAIRSLR